MSSKTVHKSKKSDRDENLLAIRALESLLAAQESSKVHLYFQNFLRGMFFSIGSIFGIAVVGTVLLWCLSLFDSFPFVEHISTAIKQSL